MTGRKLFLWMMIFTGVPAIILTIIGVVGIVKKDRVWESSRDVIVGNLRTEIEQGEYDKAVKNSRPWMEYGDRELLELRKLALRLQKEGSVARREGAMKELLESIPEEE